LQPLLLQPSAVVVIPVANLGDVNVNGVSLDEGKTVAVQGVCTEENFNSTSSTSAYLQSGQPDGTNKAGINVYSGLRNLFVRGNEYVVTGSVLNYNGLTELVVSSSSQVLSLGAASNVPTPVTWTIGQLSAAHEAYEGSLVRVTGLRASSLL
jgi:predicted extracellular nuclease